MAEQTTTGPRRAGRHYDLWLDPGLWDAFVAEVPRGQRAHFIREALVRALYERRAARAREAAIQALDARSQKELLERGETILSGLTTQ